MTEEIDETITDKDLGKLYENYMKFADKMADKYGIFAIAGVMMAQSLSLYKTILSEEDYHAMVDNISNSRDNVKSFNVEDEHVLH